MAKIIGNTVGIPNPQTDWDQTDTTKADYLKNKPENLLRGRHNTAKNWMMSSLVPEKGEVIIYDGDGSYYEESFYDIVDIPEDATILDLHIQFYGGNNVSFADKYGENLFTFNNSDLTGAYYFRPQDKIIEDSNANTVDIGFPWDEYDKIKNKIARIYSHQGFVYYKTSSDSKIKIGDGLSTVLQLPFVNNGSITIDGDNADISGVLEEANSYTDKKANKMLAEAKSYTDEMTTLGASVEKTYYSDIANDVYVFCDEYFEIPEEFNGNISEIIVSKEPGDISPYINISFYDTNYELIESIEILPENPNGDTGDGEFINVSREVNITGATYVMGSDGGCSQIGTLALINNTETALGREVAKKDAKMLEEAKAYTHKAIKEEIKSADVVNGVYTYTLANESDVYGLDCIDSFYDAYYDSESNKTVASFVIYSEKLNTRPFEIGNLKLAFFNLNTKKIRFGESDGYTGGEELWDLSVKFEGNVVDEVTEEFTNGVYTHLAINPLDKYEWKSIKDIIPDIDLGAVVEESKSYTDKKSSDAENNAKAYTNKRLDDCVVMHPTIVNSSDEWTEVELTGLEADKLKFVKISCDDAHFNTLNQTVGLQIYDNEGNGCSCDFSATYLVESRVIIDLESETLYRLFSDGRTEEIADDVYYDYDNKDLYFSILRNIKSCVLSCISELNCKAEFCIGNSASEYADNSAKEAEKSAKEYAKSYADGERVFNIDELQYGSYIYDLPANHGVKSVDVQCKSVIEGSEISFIHLMDANEEIIGEVKFIMKPSEVITVSLEEYNDVPIAKIQLWIDANDSAIKSVTYYYNSDKAYTDEKIGDIDAALDELHAYAESLKNGGAS